MQVRAGTANTYQTVMNAFDKFKPKAQLSSVTVRLFTRL
jgi:hypothetical protein